MHAAALDAAAWSVAASLAGFPPRLLTGGLAARAAAQVPAAAVGGEPEATLRALLNALCERPEKGRRW